MDRVYNFSAGPSMLPLPVLEKAQSELLNCNNSGQSVMEMSHRSKDFEPIINGAEALLREVMHIPDNYKVLFLQGGASSQFTMVPMNLCGKKNKADFVITGQWAKKAFAEAKRYINAREVASSADKTFSYIPDLDASMFDQDAAYAHICMNNTIYGTRYAQIPDTGSLPLVADISSMILSQNIDVSRFALLYAGAQKNVAPAGLTIVIVRDDLIGCAMDITPTMFNYATHSENGSMFNTPPCYQIYICKLVLEWIRDLGGLDAMEEINKEKANLFYNYLDSSSLFKGTVLPKDRSLMNIPFITGDAELDAKFVSEAKAAGFVNLKGHRSVGGMRASIYNAMPKEGVVGLIEFMKKFEAENK